MELYASGVTTLQSLGGSLNVSATVISQGAWLFACYFAATQRSGTSAGPMEAVSCLMCAEEAISQPKILIPSNVIGRLGGMTLQDGSAVTEELILECVERVKEFIKAEQFLFPRVSTFDCTMKTMDCLFGGPHWAKESFCQRVFGVAAGVVNDMCRAPDSIKYPPSHWGYAAVHYAFCDILATVSSPVESLKVWLLLLLFYDAHCCII